MKKNFLLHFSTIFFIHNLLHTGLLTASTPIISRLYGNSSQTRVPQTQQLGSSGSFTPYGDNSSGIFNLSSIGNNAIVNAVQSLLDGTTIALLSDATNTYLVKITEIGTLDTTFGQNGYYTVTNSITPAASIIVTQQNDFIIAGSTIVNPDSTTVGNPWIVTITKNGNNQNTIINYDVNTLATFAEISQLSVQSSGQLIVVGLSSTESQLLVARFNLDGSLDTNFSVNGYALFNGTNGYPTSTLGSSDIIIDNNNNIYLAYSDDNNGASIVQLSADGLTAQTIWTSNASDAAFTGASSLKIAFDSNQNIIIAGQVFGTIVVSGIATDGSTLQNFNDASSTNITGDKIFLAGLLTTSDDTIFVYGQDAFSNQLFLAELNGANKKNPGSVSSTFNNGQGFTLFSPQANSIVLLTSATISALGTIIVSGFQSANGETSSFVASLYNDYPYVSQIPQYPAIQPVGGLNTSFGLYNNSVYPAVVPLCGVYGQTIRQQAQSIIEVDDQLIVGLNGLTKTRFLSTVVFNQLFKDGTINQAFGSNGSLAIDFLDNDTNAYSVNQIINDQAGYIYIVGTVTYSPWDFNSINTNAFVAKIDLNAAQSDTGVIQPLWIQHAPILEQITTAKGVSIALVGNETVIIGIDYNGVFGGITGFSTETGALQTSFGDQLLESYLPASIFFKSFGIAMGPVYGLAVDSQGLIYAAYQSVFIDNGISVSAFTNNGSALIQSFGSNGTATNVLPVNASSTNNIRLGFDSNENLLVAAVDSTGTNVQISNVFLTDGSLNNNFGPLHNGQLVFPVANSTALQLTDVVGLSDGSSLVSYYDNVYPNADNTTYLTSITVQGTINTGFNTLSSTPGSLVLDVQHAKPAYNRVVSDILVQSSTGNVVAVGAEWLDDYHSLPFAVSIVGTVGTTQIPNYPTTIDISNPPTTETITGTNDITFGNQGLNEIQFFTTKDDTAAQQQQASVVVSYPYADGNNYLVAVNGYKYPDSPFTLLEDGSQEYFDFWQSINARTFLNVFDQNGNQTIQFDGTLLSNDGVTPLYQNSFINAILPISAYNNEFAITAGSARELNRPFENSLLTAYVLVNNQTTGAIEDIKLGQYFGGFNGSPAGVAFGDAARFNAVSLQSTGRIVASGLSQSYAGEMVGYTSNGQLDTTFGLGGSYTIPNSLEIFSQAIDAHNNIIVLYQDRTNGYVKVARIFANGSGIDESFNPNGQVPGVYDTGIPVGYKQAYVAIGQNDAIVIAINYYDQVNNVQALAIQSYNPNTFATTNFQIAFNDGQFVDAQLGSVLGFTISNLVIASTDDTNNPGKAIVVGFATYGNGISTILALSTTSDVTAIDSSFNPNNTPGFISYSSQNNAQQYTSDANIDGNGDIVIVGYVKNPIEIITPTPLPEPATPADQTAPDGQ